VISSPNSWKRILDSPGKNRACMMNRMAIVGRITLKKNLQYSPETLAINERGRITIRNIPGGVQYHGLRKTISTRESAITTFVSGFRRWIGLSRFTKKDKRSCMEKAAYSSGNGMSTIIK
jgi:hypothetical protein